MSTDPAVARDLRILNVVAVVALVDAVLLVPLVLGVVGVIDTDAYVGVLGGVHGVGFLVLVALTGLGAARRRWGWWFPLLTVATGGPLGSLVGDVIVRRRLARGPGAAWRRRTGDPPPEGA